MYAELNATQKCWYSCTREIFISCKTGIKYLAYAADHSLDDEYVLARFMGLTYVLLKATSVCRSYIHTRQTYGLDLPDLVEAPPGTDVLKLPEGLQKAESSLAIQLRTGVKGLDAFLFQARVPSVPSPLGSCGGGRQTAKQVLILCPRHSGSRHELRDEQGHLLDFSKLLGTAEGL